MTEETFKQEALRVMRWAYNAIKGPHNCNNNTHKDALECIRGLESEMHSASSDLKEFLDKYDSVAKMQQ